MDKSPVLNSFEEAKQWWSENKNHSRYARPAMVHPGNQELMRHAIEKDELPIPTHYPCIILGQCIEHGGYRTCIVYYSEFQKARYVIHRNP